MYAFLQVSALLAEDPTWSGLLRGLLVLTVLWWAWCAYVWLACAVRSEAAVVRGVMVVVVAVTAVISIAVPQALADARGGLYGPLVFVTCYAVLRLSQIAALWVTAWRERDPDRRAQAVATTWPALLALAVLLAAALVPEPVGDIRLLSPTRVALWLVAIAVDLGGARLVNVARWRIWSAPHWSDRFSLIVIIGLGEAVIAIGAAVVYTPVSGRIVVAAVLGTALLGALWWVYFGRDADVGEHALADRTGRARIALARDGYAYLHLPMIAGIVLVSLGLRKTMGGLGTQALFVDTPPLGAVPHLALFGGVLLYLVADEVFWRMATGGWRRQRLLTAAAVAALMPLTVPIGPLAALGVLVGAVLLLVAVEASGGAGVRRDDPARRTGSDA
ncbi:low temperature requirement protein A [Micromonospora sp. NPDC049799]|uniref:low temperature requirement protein A n=1 Tax=Micromonospora sp. NPDC049799 TaxID=3154741 RepID=UPI0033CBA9D5